MLWLGGYLTMLFPGFSELSLILLMVSAFAGLFGFAACLCLPRDLGQRWVIASGLALSSALTACLSFSTNSFLAMFLTVTFLVLAAIFFQLFLFRLAVKVEAPRIAATVVVQIALLLFLLAFQAGDFRILLGLISSLLSVTSFLALSRTVKGPTSRPGPHFAPSK